MTASLWCTVTGLSNYAWRSRTGRVTGISYKLSGVQYATRSKNNSRAFRACNNTGTPQAAISHTVDRSGSKSAANHTGDLRA